jgi:hypothetical protein
VAAAADAELELTGLELAGPELTGPEVTGLALEVAGGLEAGWDRSCPQLTKPIKLAAVRTPTKYVNFDIGEMIGHTRRKCQWAAALREFGRAVAG